MKPTSKAILTLLFTLTSIAASAQISGTKSKIFSHLPEQITCSETIFADALTHKAGEQIAIKFSADFVFTGTVISNIARYSNLQTMLIRSDRSDNTIFQLSRQINEDKSTNFVGRMLNKESADGYVIEKNEKGIYSLNKIETANILQDCSYIK